MYFVSNPYFIPVVLKVQMMLISMILTTSYHAAYSDPSGGLELNIAPVISPVKTLCFPDGITFWNNRHTPVAAFSKTGFCQLSSNNHYQMASHLHIFMLKQNKIC